MSFINSSYKEIVIVMNIYSVDTLKNILTYHLHIFHVWGTTRGIRLQEAFHLEVSNADFYLLNFYVNSWEGSAEDDLCHQN